MSQNIFIGSDHGGPEAKQKLISYLEEQYPTKILTKFGPDITNDKVDYPDVAKDVCTKVLETKNSIGFLICGTGQGINIAANKIEGIRSGVIHNKFSSKMTVEHNNCNVFCFGAREGLFDGFKTYIDIILNSEFEGDRHSIRVAKLTHDNMNGK